ncbi:MAG: type II toxin-antitoxin system HicB family antitoxin [Thermodesulfobacteriota bacterium]
MKNKTMTYQGYIGSVEYDIEDEFLYGKVLHVNDTVTFESTTIAGLKKEFIAAVDDYLATCKQIGKEPQKSFKGSLNIRLGESAHRKAAICAGNQDITLNDFIKNAVLEAVNKDQKAASAPKVRFTETPEYSSMIKPRDIVEDLIPPEKQVVCHFQISNLSDDNSRVH